MLMTRARIRAFLSTPVLLALAALAAPAFAPEKAWGQAQILEVHEARPDLDTRTGELQPTSTQKGIVTGLGATVRWNRFGTPQSLVKYGGFLATGRTGESASAARGWIRDNRVLFRLSNRRCPTWSC